MDDSFWFEKIPLDEFDENKRELMTKLCATKWSTNMKFYRKIRSPLNMADLTRFMRGFYLVWLDDECFMMMRKLPKTVGAKFRKGTTNIQSTRKVVARATEQILYLKDDTSEEVTVGNHYPRGAGGVTPTTFITSRFVRDYMQANAHRRLTLGYDCQLSKEESMALVSYPGSLNVGLECRFVDQGRTFVETLSQRTTYFGVLALHQRSFGSLYLMYMMHSSLGLLSEITRALAHISLETSNAVFAGSHCLLPLSAPVRHLEYSVYNQMELGETESLTVIPKAVTLEFRYSLDTRFHTMFLQASGKLQELGLIYSNWRVPSAAQQTELLHAIRTNQNLYRLKLGDLNVLRGFWKQLLEVIGSHSSLRLVMFSVQDARPDLEQVKALVPLLKERIQLDVSFKSRGEWSDLVDQMEAIIEPVRCRNRARALTREPGDDRPALFGAALTKWAGSDFHKTSSLLSEHTDLLCSLIGDPSS